MLDRNDKDGQIYFLRNALERIVEKTSDPRIAGYDEQKLYRTVYVDKQCSDDAARIASSALADTTF